MESESEKLPELIGQVLQRQHDELRGQLEQWLKSLAEVIQVSQSLQLDLPAELIPSLESAPQRRSKQKVTLRESKTAFLEAINDSGKVNSSAAEAAMRVLSEKSVDFNQTPRKETAEAQAVCSDGTMDSYRRAHRHGSIVDHFKRFVSEEVATPGPKHNACQSWCAKLIGSQVAEVIFALAILTNSIFIGVELEWRAAHPDRESLFFFVVNLLYATVFLVEVCLGLFGYGLRQYFCSRQSLWNYLDFCVVLISWTELFFIFFSVEGWGGLSSSSLRMLRLIKVSRVARVLRVLRVIKIVHYIRPLRTLVHCVVDTTKSFVWALILILLMMYVFALLFTDAVLSYSSESAQIPSSEGAQIPESERLLMLFGSVYGSITTLFQSISKNGLDWNEAASALDTVGWFWVIVYNLYIAFTSWVLLNVMTGVFCNSAIKVAESDHEMVIQSLMHSKKNFLELVENLFHRIDDLGLGIITIAEFERHFNDVQVRAFFESLEMGAVDAWTLFASLDADGDNVISLNDFIERCTQLHGPARSVDLYSLKQLTALAEATAIKTIQAKLRQEVQVMNDKLNERSPPWSHFKFSTVSRARVQEMTEQTADELSL